MSLADDRARSARQDYAARQVRQEADAARYAAAHGLEADDPGTAPRGVLPSELVELCGSADNARPLLRSVAYGQTRLTTLGDMQAQHDQTTAACRPGGRFPPEPQEPAPSLKINMRVYRELDEDGFL